MRALALALVALAAVAGCSYPTEFPVSKEIPNSGDPAEQAMIFIYAAAPRAAAANLGEAGPKDTKSEEPDRRRYGAEILLEPAGPAKPLGRSPYRKFTRYIGAGYTVIQTPPGTLNVSVIGRDGAYFRYRAAALHLELTPKSKTYVRVIPRVRGNNWTEISRVDGEIEVVSQSDAEQEVDAAQSISHVECGYSPSSGLLLCPRS